MKYPLLLIAAAMICACGTDHGKSVTANGHKLYYTDPVTETEATKVLAWLHNVNHNFGEPEQPFQLSKTGNTYVFRYPVQNNTPEEIEGNMGYIRTFREKLSQDALNNAPVEIHLVDVKLKPIRKITAQ